jgi:hypothetical protein
MKEQLKVVSLVFNEGFRAFAQKAQAIGVKECRWSENKDRTVTARFIMRAKTIPAFAEAADEFGFDPDETLRNFDLYRTSSDASVEQEALDAAGVDDVQDVDTDGIGEEVEDDGEEDVDNDEVGAEIDADAFVTSDEREPDEGDPFEGKTGGAFGEADTSLPDLSPKLVTPGSPLKVDTRPSKINQDVSDSNEGVGGEIAKDVKAIISKEGIVAPKSFKVPGFKLKVEGGVDKIRIVPKKAKKKPAKKSIAQKKR